MGTREPKADGSSINRRNVLKLAGAAAASISVAGCIGDGDDDTDDTVDPGDDSDDGMTDPGDDSDDGTTDPGDDDEEVLRMTYSEPVYGLDPHDAGGANEENTYLHIYEQPLFRAQDLSLEPRLATDWERIEDGRDRLYIREGVTFHNGDELTPEDVHWSVQRIMDHDVHITSIQAHIEGITDSEVVEDEHAVDLISEGGFNYLAFHSAADGLPVMQHEWWDNRTPDEVAADANGTGPFQLDDFESGVATEMVPYEDYWDEQPPWDRVIFEGAAEDSTRVNRLLAGETDIVQTVPPGEASRIGEEGYTLHSARTARIVFAIFKTDIAPYESREFRQALNYAVDQDLIIEEILDGFGDPINQPTPEGHIGHNPDIPDVPYDPERAEELVEESGHAGADITFEVPIGAYTGGVDAAVAAGNMIDDLDNVSCTVEQREAAALDGYFDNDIDTLPEFSLVGMGSKIPDFIRYFGVVVTSGPLTEEFQQTWVGYEHSGIPELIKEVTQIVETEDRIPLYHEISQMVYDGWPFLWFYVMHELFGTSDRVDFEPWGDARHMFAFDNVLPS